MRLFFTLISCFLLPVAVTAQGGPPGRAAGNAAPRSPAAHPPVAEQTSLEFIENRGQWVSAVRYRAALPGGGQLFAEADGLRLALLEPGALPHSGSHSADSARGRGRPDPGHTLRGHAFDLRFVDAAPTARPEATEATAERRNYLQGNDPARWASDVRSYRELRYAGLWPGVDARLYENAGQRLEYDFVLAAGADPAAIGLRHAGAAVALDAAGNLLVTTSVGTVRELAPQAWQLDAASQRRPIPCRYQLSPDGTVRFGLGDYDRARPLTIDPTLVFSTYTGSTATNWGFTATYDAAGNLYSGGIAFSLGYPTSPGAFQTTYGGQMDMALIKYNVTQSGPAARAWATYLGGSQADFPHSLVVNSQGELLVLGSTGSANFPTTAGAVQRTFAGGTLADPFGEGSISSGFYQLPNGSDLVVCRLSATGTALRASTYLGGSGNDGLLPLEPFSNVVQLAHNYGDSFRGDIVVDAADDVYLASCTSSPNFPVGTGFQSSYRGGTSDGVVCKLKGDLTAVLWGGYLGGSASDAAYSLQLAPGSGDVYVAGGTISPNLPATAGALNPAALGNVDGFAARIAAGGTSLLRTTYLGTSAYDQAFFLQLGTDGGVYVLGQTLGAYPTTPGLYGIANGRQFIHKLSADLSRTELATVFGSGRTTIDIAPTAFLVDRCDRVYVCGWGGLGNQGGAYLAANAGSSTTGLPVTAYAMQSLTDGSDFYLAQFAAGLTALGYGTFFGSYDGSTSSFRGEHVDGGTSRFDPRGVVYQAVCSCGSSTGFPIPPGTNYYSATNNAGGSCNNAAFVLNFQPDVANVGPAQTVCFGGPSLLEGTPNGGVWTGPGVSGSVATGWVFTPPALGTYTLTYTVATGQCSSTATRQMTAVTAATVSIDASLKTAYCVPVGTTLPTVPLVGSPAGGTFSGPGVFLNGTGGQVFSPSSLPAGTSYITYTYTAGCTVKVAREVQVVRADAGYDQTVCAGTAAFALVGLPSGGTWTGPGVSGSVAVGFVFTPTATLAGVQSLTYSRQADDRSCTASSVRRVTVVDVGSLDIPPLPAVMCFTDPTRYPLPAGGSWSGWNVGQLGNGEYFFAPSYGTGSFYITHTVGLGTPCYAARSYLVTVVLPQPATVPADTLLCPGTTRPFALRGGRPAGGTWAGPGVSGSLAAGFVFTPPPGFQWPASLVYTAASGTCLSPATRRVGVAPVPALRPAWEPVACVEARQAPLTVRFTDAAGNADTRWDFGDGSPAATGAEVQHTYATAGRYQPQVSLRYFSAQCETTAPLPAIEVQNQSIPNILLPTGNPTNRTFRLPPNCAPRIQLFSRWGQQVFEAAAYQNDWDAAGQAAGLYYYLLTYPDGHRVKGWVEVVR